MIRIVTFLNNSKAYGYDITGWDEKYSDYYDNLLTEDLVERVNEGDILIYFGSIEDAEEWCENHDLEFELVKSEENDNN